ncbi:MAG: prepilin-type N-terminal cleavage/methylation domain-containing protein [Sumerlaeia bacterium]
MNKIFRAKAFTLIELLIVVAIIAILAAIAVPNFLEAQTRSKVSRTKADMRTIATALESYAVDWNAYPNANAFGSAAGLAFELTQTSPLQFPTLERLSTPVAYLSSAIIRDPFNVSFRVSAGTAAGILTASPIQVDLQDDVIGKTNTYVYQSWNSDQRFTVQDFADSFADENKPTKSTAWLLHSAGPDSTYHNLGGVLANDFADNDASVAACTGLIYDPTNGTVSFGSIYREGGSAAANPTGSPPYAAGSALVEAIRKQN